MRQLMPLVLAAALAGCATNPVTGQKQFNLLSEAEELAIGQQSDAEIRREMGVYDNSELQRYVSNIGLKMAAQSHRPTLPWSFTIVDAPAINAFAVPGGYIYITRGILPYLDDEAELAGVIGHEIGHITARHAAAAYSRQAGGGLGLAILSIFVPQTAPFQDLSSLGLNVLFLKYGRDQELQSDRLGMEYASKVGFDPTGVPRFLTTLSRVSETSERGVPNWLSTHPEPGSRVKDAEPEAAKFISDTSRAQNRDQFLRAIDGLVVGDNPQDGIVRGHVFLHPMLRIGLEFPPGWEVVNTAETVMAREPGTQHFMLLQQVAQPRGTDVGMVAANAMRSAGYTEISGERTRIGGRDAYVGVYRGNLNGVGRVVMRSAHINMGRQTYVVAGFAPEKEFDLVDRDLQPAVRSFRELSQSEASQIRPNRLAFYTTRPGDSWQSIAQRAGRGITSAATLAIMNNHAVSDQPQAGERIKIVVEG